ncbi:unnamed protein product, partial [Allacma fusca]
MQYEFPMDNLSNVITEHWIVTKHYQGGCDLKYSSTQ